MNLRSMLNEVGILVPNDIPLDVQVSWMNQVQSSLYRFYQTEETASQFIVQPTDAFYDLPPNCLADRTRRLVLDEKEIPYIVPGEEEELFSEDKYWTIVNNQIALSWIPDKMYTATLYFLARPAALSLDAIDAEAAFPSDFIELLIVGCAAKVAMATKATDLLGPLQMQFESVKRRAEQIIGNKGPKSVNIVRAYV